MKAGKGIKRFLIGQFTDKLQRGANVICGEVVFPLDLLEGHSSSEATDDKRDRHAGAANHRLSVADSRVDNNAIMSVHGLCIAFYWPDSKHKERGQECQSREWES